MGNIRQTNIKRIAFQLIEDYGDVFTKDFETNKALVTKYTTIESKVIRNRVAGYVTRKVARMPSTLNILKRTTSPEEKMPQIRRYPPGGGTYAITGC